MKSTTSSTRGNVKVVRGLQQYTNPNIPMSFKPRYGWSTHTTYTGVAGIHSEVRPAAAIRNSLMNKRSSNIMTIEEVIVRKQLQTLGFNKRSMEKSMLMYSQKMRDISAGKSKLAKLPENTEAGDKTPEYVNDYNKTKQKNNKKPQPNSRHGAVSPITCINDEGPIKQTDFVSSKKSLRSSISSLDTASRSSVDSGISLDTRSECSDAFSQAYISDTDSHDGYLSGSSLIDSAREIRKVFEGSGSLSDRTARRRRARRRRLGAEGKPELPTVRDAEHREVEEENPTSSDNKLESNCDETFSIAPFPACSADSNVPLLQLDMLPSTDMDEKTQTKILNPLSNTGYWSYRAANSARDPPPAAVNKKPKAVNSPSVTSIRLRKPKAKPKPSKPFHQVFRYSDVVDNAVRGVGNKAECKKRNESLTYAHLEAVDLDELRQEHFLRSIRESPENNCDLSRERSLSAPPETIESPVINEYIVVQDLNTPNTLKSAMKKDSLCSDKKKSVQFHLPDIFKHPVTSR